jgi:hypothetical protein
MMRKVARSTICQHVKHVAVRLYQSVLVVINKFVTKVKFLLSRLFGNNNIRLFCFCRMIVILVTSLLFHSAGYYVALGWMSASIAFFLVSILWTVYAFLFAHF